MNRLTYTKAIRGGRLKATEMLEGESVVGTLKDFKPGKYGNIIVLEVNGKDVEIFPAGNMKFLERDVADGKKSFDLVTTFTRVANKQIKGYNVSQFEISQAQGAAATAAPTTTTETAAVPSIQDKLAAIRANRAPANGTNA